VVDETARYYAARASVYDETAGYRDPAAEALRRPIKARYQGLFRGHDVLEIACGTGYWTAVIGEVARSVLATDLDPSVLDLARDRCRQLDTVRFQVADACSLDGVPAGFTAALGVWWWSHLRRESVPSFIAALHARLEPGSLVLFTDQLPYEGPERRLDPAGNTLEQRSLPDGRTFWVVKNFPTEAELRADLQDVAADLRYVPRPEEEHWDLLYRTR
jgi:demethylmenaquinone methyltransferase/2-methoxy-6-polyprenyl-1,4-benzoquinol methylase